MNAEAVAMIGGNREAVSDGTDMHMTKPNRNQNSTQTTTSHSSADMMNSIMLVLRVYPTIRPIRHAHGPKMLNRLITFHLCCSNIFVDHSDGEPTRPNVNENTY